PNHHHHRQQLQDGEENPGIRAHITAGIFIPAVLHHFHLGADRRSHHTFTAHAGHTPAVAPNREYAVRSTETVIE
ncbi:MAG: hypothetical protein LAT79_17955, partial [Kiritimatiellae bacterium]|nr:hypothetical protein [Kiritimatiellia bacterium]